MNPCSKCGDSNTDFVEEGCSYEVYLECSECGYKTHTYSYAERIQQLEDNLVDDWNNQNKPLALHKRIVLYKNYLEERLTNRGPFDARKNLTGRLEMLEIILGWEEEV